MISSEHALKLKRDVEFLEEIHLQVSSSQHSISYVNKNRFENQKPFVPSNFIYVFFTFNTLYNIDWNNTSGLLDFECSISDRGYFKNNSFVKGKIDLFLDFCFENSDFVNSYKSQFYYILSYGFSTEEMRNAISSISVGGKIDEKKREQAINSFNVLLCEDGYCKVVISKIVYFIYDVRCNMFHGNKTLKQMTTSLQGSRLLLYRNFVIALNQMLFSYIDYVSNVRDNSFKKLKNALQMRRASIENICKDRSPNPRIMIKKAHPHPIFDPRRRR